MQPHPDPNPKVRQVSASGNCRFCQISLETNGSAPPLCTPCPALAHVCADEECVGKRELSCQRMLPCGHPCGGVRGESTCLPCLYGCGGGGEEDAMRPEAEDLCRICWTEELRAGPAVQLKCGHTFHHECISRLVGAKWLGARITFGFLQCPLCRQQVESPALSELLEPMIQLRDVVTEKALQRLAHEGRENDEALRKDGDWEGDKAGYAMHIYAYYQCYKCQQPYFGGNYECAAGNATEFDPSELVCPGCSITGGEICPRHGKEYLEFKCRYCCSVAIWFCFGTTHFCETCHNNLDVQNIPKEQLPVCPAGPAGKQLSGECPLKLDAARHPKTGEEFALGCSICRRAQGF